MTREMRSWRQIALEQWRSGAVRQPWVRWLNKPAEVDPLIITMEGHTGPITRSSSHATLFPFACLHHVPPVLAVFTITNLRRHHLKIDSVSAAVQGGVHLRRAQDPHGQRGRVDATLGCVLWRSHRHHPRPSLAGGCWLALVLATIVV
eukprot:3390797-Rhodomonas_salina.3